MNIEGSVAKKRLQNLSKTQLKIIPLKEYGDFKRKDIKEEIDRQFKLREERNRKKYFIDPLLINKNNRYDRIYKKYVSYARFVGNYWDREYGDMRFVSDYDGKNRMAVIRVEGWINYSRRYGTFRKMSGLVLFDRDSKEYRFLRVSPKITAVKEALDYIKPAAVKEAEAKGKEVIRQGDIYFVPARKWSVDNLGNHRAEKMGDTVIIKHPTHPPVVLDSPHRAYQQMTVQNTAFSNGGGRASGFAD
jgi:hypothetical protein